MPRNAITRSTGSPGTSAASSRTANDQRPRPRAPAIGNATVILGAGLEIRANVSPTRSHDVERQDRECDRAEPTRPRWRLLDCATSEYVGFGARARFPPRVAAERHRGHSVLCARPRRPTLRRERHHQQFEDAARGRLRRLVRRIHPQICGVARFIRSINASHALKRARAGSAIHTLRVALFTYHQRRVYPHL